MNILPKKRWHVRTKENIARVRKDEAEAAEKEREERLRIETADKEARLSILKEKSKQKLLESGIKTPELDSIDNVGPSHINLFTDCDHMVKTCNKEHDEEVKNKKEEYEKKIGYLTYLGQDTNEALGKKNWYEVPPNERLSTPINKIKQSYDALVLKNKDGTIKEKELDEKDGEIAWKIKQANDPINSFRHCLPKCKSTRKEHLLKDKPYEKQKKISKHKNKKEKKQEKEEKLKKLRQARLKREQIEKMKSELFLRGLSGEPVEEKKDSKLKPKYNSQFNPELARQNYNYR